MYQVVLLVASVVLLIPDDIKLKVHAFLSLLIVSLCWACSPACSLADLATTVAAGWRHHAGDRHRHHLRRHHR